MTELRDAIGIAIVSGRLASVVDEMKVILRNTARSNRISVRRQFGCALLDPTCAVVATDNPRYLGTLQESVASCVNEFAFDFASDDVILTNDPYGGSPSIHHFTLVKPVTDGQDSLGYVAVQAHMSDIGGMVMGNYDVEARELRTEGVRFTPMRLVRFGRMRRYIFDTLVLNSRTPETFAGDLRAMLACLDVGERAMKRQLSRYGASFVMEAMAASISHAERSMRQGLAKIGEGSYTGAATLEQDGHGSKDLRIQATLTQSSAGTIIDFTGTDRQSAGFVNCPPATTRTVTLLQLLGLVDDQVNYNSGLLRALKINLPEGTLVSPAYPAPTGWSAEHVSYEIGEAIRRALVQALPQAGGPGYPSRSFAMTVRRQMRVGMTIEQIGVTDLAALAQPGSGAAFGADGWGQPGAEALGEAPSVEEFESGTDFEIRRMEFDIDSGGAGRWRGAPGVTTVVAVPPDVGEQLYALAVNSRSGPEGVAGGAAGAAGALLLTGENGEREVVSGVVAARPLQGRVTLDITAPGGSGFGSPSERPREAVLDDLRNGYISAAVARQTYRFDPSDERRS